MSFDQWCDELDHVAIDHIGACGYKTGKVPFRRYAKTITEATGRECWKPAYEEGDTPLEALLNELSYA